MKLIFFFYLLVSQLIVLSSFRWRRVIMMNSQKVVMNSIWKNWLKNEESKGMVFEKIISNRPACREPPPPQTVDGDDKEKFNEILEDFVRITGRNTSISTVKSNVDNFTLINNTIPNLKEILEKMGSNVYSTRLDYVYKENTLSESPIFDITGTPSLYPVHSSEYRLLHWWAIMNEWNLFHSNFSYLNYQAMVENPSSHSFFLPTASRITKSSTTYPSSLPSYLSPYPRLNHTALYEHLADLCRHHQGQLIAIGDVHGCIDELKELISTIMFYPNDKLLFVGDLVAKGPACKEVITLAMDLESFAIRGNHDEALIRSIRAFFQSILLRYLREQRTLMKQRRKRNSSSSSSSSSSLTSHSLRELTNYTIVPNITDSSSDSSDEDMSVVVDADKEDDDHADDDDHEEEESEEDEEVGTVEYSHSQSITNESDETVLGDISVVDGLAAILHNLSFADEKTSVAINQTHLSSWLIPFFANHPTSSPKRWMNTGDHRNEFLTLISTLSAKELLWLYRLPLLIYCQELQTLFVHAAINLPQISHRVTSVSKQRNVLLYGSSQLPNSSHLQFSGISYDGYPWAKQVTGPYKIYFGHDSCRGLQQYPFAMGIDTGCVHGGNLTAVILPREEIVTVTSFRRYAKMLRKPNPYLPDATIPKESDE